MKKVEKHFVNHSEVLKITGSVRYELMEKLKKDPNDEGAKFQLGMLEHVSEQLTCALFQKGDFKK